MYLRNRTVENRGIGFDMNLLTGIEALKSDYVYLMSDDDEFIINPFNAIDKAFGWFKKDCYLFNHNDKSSGKSYIKKKHWKNYLQLKFSLPRYCGLMYRVSFLQKLSLKEFDKTLHLYGAPFIYAIAKKQVKFIKTRLLVFNDEDKEDGAWQSIQKVIDGLKIFLAATKKILPEKKYNNLAEAFFNCYFSPESWLIKARDAKKHNLMK